MIFKKNNIDNKKNASNNEENVNQTDFKLNEDVTNEINEENEQKTIEKERVDLNDQFGETLDPEFDTYNLRTNEVAFKNEIKRLNEENSKLKETYLRKTAEFENYKKAMIKQRQDDKIYMGCEIISNFLPIFENIKRALESCTNNHDDSVISGLKMIKNQFEKILFDMGVAPIECLGKTFDPNLHEAVSSVQKEGVEANTIVEVYQDGYTYKEKVIKPSIVCVAN